MPVTLTAAERQAAEAMLTDLIWHHREISLVPAPRPMHSTHKIRMQTGWNAKWYQDLARDVGLKRRRRPRRAKYFDTDIRRDAVRSCLKRLARGAAVRTRYDHLLLVHIRAEAWLMTADEVTARNGR